VPGRPVRDRSADEQEHHQRQGPGRGHQTDVAPVPARVQHRERGAIGDPFAPRLVMMAAVVSSE